MDTNRPMPTESECPCKAYLATLADSIRAATVSPALREDFVTALIHVGMMLGLESEEIHAMTKDLTFRTLSDLVKMEEE